MSFQVSGELKKCLLLEDIQGYHPEHDPFVYVARSLAKRLNVNQIQGELREFIGTRAFLVPITQKELVMMKFTYENFDNAGRSYFDDNRSYFTGETFERNGVSFEIIVNYRRFEGLDLSYYEPTDRLVIYLSLHRKGNNWINPRTQDTIVQTGDTIRGLEPHDAYLSIRKSELIDYLAARRCGLLLLKYSERVLETPIELIGLPEPFNDRATQYGRLSWIIDRSPSNRENYMYYSSLWESFWIDPASRPRRWDAQPPEEIKNGVPFVASDGEYVIYKQESKDRYFEILSFNPRLLKVFTSLPNNRIEFSCLTNLTLHYADASQLDGCINREGQFQCFFGLVAKLEIEKQRQLAGFSEPKKAKPSYEYFRTNIEALFPETMPFNWTLSRCLGEVNSPWQEKYGDTLLLSPAKNEIPISVLLGPTSNDFDELADVMLELQKSVISESKIQNIKKQLNHAFLASNIRSYEEMGSISFTQLFFSANRGDRKEGESYILDAIRELRNCKGHIKDMGKTLGKFNIPATSPRASFLYVMAEFCVFLLAFKTMTEKTFRVTVGTARQKIDDPWLQLQTAHNYFLNPF